MSHERETGGAEDIPYPWRAGFGEDDFKASALFCAPSRSGRFARLRPLLRRDLPILFELVGDEQVGARWRLRGKIPREEGFEAYLWQGALTQLVICGPHDDHPLGLVVAYGANIGAGTAYLGVVLSREFASTGVGLEAYLLFCEHVFATYRLRKLYLEAPIFNCAQFRHAIGVWLHIEGRLRDHEYYGGRFWDSLLLATYPEDVVALRDELFSDARSRSKVNSRIVGDLVRSSDGWNRVLSERVCGGEERGNLIGRPSRESAEPGGGRSRSIGRRFRSKP